MDELRAKDDRGPLGLRQPAIIPTAFRIHG